MKGNRKKGKPDQRLPAEAEFIGMAPKITKLLQSESDRGAILILGAYLDEILGLIVRAACVSDEAAEAILAVRKPAGDFDSRILIGFAFGLIHSEDVKALRIVQKIRNKAAHFERGGRGFDVLFDSTPTADHVCALAEGLNLRLKSKDPGAIRDGFIVSARLLATRLLVRLAQVRHNHEPIAVKEHANAIRARMKGTPMGEIMERAEQHAHAGDLGPLLEINAALGQAFGKSASRVDQDPGSEGPAQQGVESDEH